LLHVVMCWVRGESEQVCCPVSMRVVFTKCGVDILKRFDQLRLRCVILHFITVSFTHSSLIYIKKTPGDFCTGFLGVFSPSVSWIRFPALNTTNRPLVDTGHLASALFMHCFSFETKRERRYSQKRENLIIKKASRNHSGMWCVHLCVSVAIMEMWRADWLSGRVHTADSCCAYTMYTMTPVTCIAAGQASQ